MCSDILIECLTVSRAPALCDMLNNTTPVVYTNHQNLHQHHYHRHHCVHPLPVDKRCKLCIAAEQSTGNAVVDTLLLTWTHRVSAGGEQSRLASRFPLQAGPLCVHKTNRW